jgi:hypothetical protein
MASAARRVEIGSMVVAGGLLGLVLAPVMVTIKYMTGWAVVPQPGWVGGARSALGELFPTTTPAQLWVWFGTGYTAALLLMLVGLLRMRRQVSGAASRPVTIGYWIVVTGLCLVIPGDAVHTWTWHQDGLTTPTPGTNPLANTAYAIHMMGMNLVMVGSLVVGVMALRGKRVARWLAWSFALIFPTAVMASLTMLPTTPSGALWFFSAMMVAYGFTIASGREARLAAA